jgi:hypothetical protein
MAKKKTTKNISAFPKDRKVIVISKRFESGKENK